jgi:hypothetical protein
MSYFQSTTVQIETCLRCNQPILTAWVEGLRVRVDLDGVRDETAAHNEGRATYSLTRSRQLIERRPGHIPTNVRGPVLGAHPCYYTKAWRVA